MKSFLIRLLFVLAGIALLLAAAHFVRVNRARQIVAQARAEVPTPLANIGSTRSLSILPLVEAAADESTGLQGEFGVSYLVRTDDAVILLDLGENERRTDPTLLEANMRLLKVDPQLLGALVISHNHPDHVGGMDWWLKHTFSFGKQQISLAGISVYLPTMLNYPGVQPVVSDAPVKIAEGVATSGCGHPGLESMLQRAEAVFGLPVVGVVGGLHYQNAGAAALQPHIDFLTGRNPRLVALSPHDSSAAVLQAFQQAFPDAYQKVEVGVEIRFP
jgi:7,8-dihydropterin-6-yl-methyl-4-(beta-D-ribofuranosyl)aminobenzene 5'-phosphate synthase